MRTDGALVSRETPLSNYRGLLNSIHQFLGSLLVSIVLVGVPDNNCRLALNRHRLHSLSSECCLYKEDLESTIPQDSFFGIVFRLFLGFILLFLLPEFQFSLQLA